MLHTFCTFFSKIGGMKTMPNTTSKEKLRWIKLILGKEIIIKKMAKISLLKNSEDRTYRLGEINIGKHLLKFNKNVNICI